MERKELHELWETIQAEARTNDRPLPEARREQLIQERLPDLLKARYGGPENRLSEAGREATAARLLAAARERGRQTSDVRRPAPPRLLSGFWGLLSGYETRIAAGLAVIALMLGSFAGWRLFGGPELPGGIRGTARAPAVTLIRAPAGAQVPEGLLDPDGVLHLTYGLGQNGFYVQARDGGWTFSAPVRLNRRADSVMAGGERGPKLAYGKDGILHVVWLGQGPRPQGVWYTRSTDGGQNFEPERNLLDTPAHCDSATVAADQEGNVWVFWLDERQPPDPKSPLASPIFMALSSDGGRTFSRNQRVRHDHPGLACACCQLIARVGSDGALYLSFRSGYQNVRDAYLLKGPKRGNDFRSVRVSEDDWLFAG